MNNVLQLAIQYAILIAENKDKVVFLMATKTANVTARVQPDIKQQAEQVLERLGVPVSVLIDTLYRQIIMTGGIPYSLTVPTLPAEDSMTREEFDEMLQKGLTQAKAGHGRNVRDVFAEYQKPSLVLY